MTDDAVTVRDASGGEPAADDQALTPAMMRDNVIRLAFGGDEERYRVFSEMVRAAVPDRTRVVLRGSSVTGIRWRDGAGFDADGPGTSDLDLTLVGEEAIRLFKLKGFYVPGVHSRPVSDAAPDIAPDLVPLREALVALAGRPVNIQATRDFVMHLRGDVLGQPYFVLVDVDPDDLGEPPP